VNSGHYYATGRRKAASARIFLKEGTGKTTVNGKALEDYFGAETIWKNRAIKPLMVLLQSAMFDISATVKGGGINGQAGAVSLGIARALDLFAKKNSPELDLEQALTQAENNEVSDSTDEQNETLGIERWHGALREAGLLTRDSRRVLRKKVGLVKARKAKQFSKR
jgi:small subunit ribosomal protein S9